MALIVVLLAGSGVVFRMSVEVHRKATATAEISRKLLAIVQQLDQDFESLRHDGEIFMAWVPGSYFHCRSHRVVRRNLGRPFRVHRFLGHRIPGLFVPDLSSSVGLEE